MITIPRNSGEVNQKQYPKSYKSYKLVLDKYGVGYGYLRELLESRWLIRLGKC